MFSSMASPSSLSLSLFYCSFLHTHLTYKGRDADVLSIVDPHDGRDDLVDEALRHTQLQQRIRKRPSGHVDEATPPERVQQLLHRAEGVAVGLVLVDPILYMRTHTKLFI